MGGRGAMTARHVNQEKPKSSFHFYFFFSAQRCISRSRDKESGENQWGNSMDFFFSLVSLLTLKGTACNFHHSLCDLGSHPAWFSLMLACTARPLDVRRLCQHLILTRHRLTFSSLGQRAVVASRPGAERRLRCWCKASSFRFRCRAQLHFLAVKNPKWPSVQHLQRFILHWSDQEICECEVTQNFRLEFLKISISISDKYRSPSKAEGIFHHRVHGSVQGFCGFCLDFTDGVRNGYKYSNSLVQAEVADGRETVAKWCRGHLLSPGRVNRPTVLRSVSHLIDVASDTSLYMVLNLSPGAF